MCGFDDLTLVLCRYELASVKRQLKEVGGRSALQGEHMRTFDQRILSLESEIRIQDKKLRETESKLSAYQQQLSHAETQLGNSLIFQLLKFSKILVDITLLTKQSGNGPSRRPA